MVLDSPYYSVYEELASPEQTATEGGRIGEREEEMKGGGKGKEAKTKWERNLEGKERRLGAKKKDGKWN
ncbi:hypothetical protein Tco_0678522 [Tanacetum coccineum]|uniref:Uncharacterized protein n=1 Tax=Tanacetum coccineum TaxID=301880 RepID=A0ABQ4XFC3_9ASTR